MKSPALRVEPSAACALIRSESEGDLGGGETLSEEAHVPNSRASFSEAIDTVLGLGLGLGFGLGFGLGLGLGSGLGLGLGSPRRAAAPRARQDIGRYREM